MTLDEKYMRQAINQAKRGQKIGEVPIGCVIVYEGKIIGRGYNKRKTKKTTLAHAEIEAIAKAGKIIKDWRLEDCDIYITLEPCQMCAGAILQARMRRCIIGCMSPKAGCAGSILNILQNDAFNHKVEITEGVLEEECSSLLTAFFKDLRVRNAALKNAGGTTDEENTEEQS